MGCAAVLCVITLSHGTHYADYAVFMLLIITLVVFFSERKTAEVDFVGNLSSGKKHLITFLCRKPFRTRRKKKKKKEQIMINSSTQDVAFNEEKHLRTR